jgi:hypothetical protein
MKTTALFSPEPAKGWMPWGALAPVLCLVIVALPAIAAWKIEKIFGLVSAKGDPLGFAGLCSVLFIEFGVTGALLFGWVRLVERRSLPTIGLVAERPLQTFLSGQAVGDRRRVVAAIFLGGGYAVGRPSRRGARRSRWRRSSFSSSASPCSRASRRSSSAAGSCRRSPAS